MLGLVLMVFGMVAMTIGQMIGLRGNYKSYNAYALALWKGRTPGKPAATCSSLSCLSQPRHDLLV